MMAADLLETLVASSPLDQLAFDIACNWSVIRNLPPAIFENGLPTNNVVGDWQVQWVVWRTGTSGVPRHYGLRLIRTGVIGGIGVVGDTYLLHAKQVNGQSQIVLEGVPPNAMIRAFQGSTTQARVTPARLQAFFARYLNANGQSLMFRSCFEFNAAFWYHFSPRAAFRRYATETALAAAAGGVAGGTFATLLLALLQKIWDVLDRDGDAEEQDDSESGESHRSESSDEDDPIDSPSSEDSGDSDTGHDNNDPSAPNEPAPKLQRENLVEPVQTVSPKPSPAPAPHVISFGWRSGAVVDCLSFYWSDGRKPVRGGAGSDKKTILLEPGEHIVKLTWSHDPDRGGAVCGLYVVTNKRENGPYGNSDQWKKNKAKWKGDQMPGVPSSISPTEYTHKGSKHDGKKTTVVGGLKK